MSRFPLEWLRLREPFDHAARSAAIVETLLPALPEGRPLRILELGAGRGSGMRYLAPRLPVPQHWTLVDHDPDLLAAVGPPPGEGITLETLEMDLASPDSLSLEVDLVSTQALLDLVSEAWLESLARWLVDRRLPLIAALSVDGRVEWLPQDERDAGVQAAFRAHQLTDRGFGRSPGPEAATVLSGMLSAAGYSVTLARADWDVGPLEQEMLKEMVAGIASAATEASQGIIEPATVAAWKQDRLDVVAGQGLSLKVGHLDLVAHP